MFIIKNISTSDVVLDDLRIVLGPQKEIDLDKVAARTLTEYSPKLRLAVQHKKIRIINKDLDGFLPNGSPPVGTSSLDTAALSEMEARLKNEFAEKLNSKDSQISELTTALHALVAQLSKQQPQTVVVHQGSGSIEKSFSEFKPSDISDDVAGSIHAKAMRKYEQNVTGHIEHEGKTVADDTLANNINELEGLI